MHSSKAILIKKNQLQCNFRSILCEDLESETESSDSIVKEANDIPAIRINSFFFLTLKASIFSLHSPVMYINYLFSSAK